MSAVCPHCGQRVLIRHGERLSPKLADIFDAIERMGSAGIPKEQLAWMFFGKLAGREAKKSVAMAVYKINDLMSATDVQICGRVHNGPYKVVRNDP